MAVVYLGRDLLLNREVAIKVLRDQYARDGNFLKRFEREGQIAAGMTHPNIVNVYDVGHDHDMHYIVMEFIRGPNLKELIQRQGPFSVDGAVFVIGQVAAALDYAHQRGLVHRDIKPQNILVDREGNAKVVDFGIAKGMRDPHLTEAGTGMGTVHYVSPEQARGLEIGPASDLYSTGVVLYEMLTGHLPFDAETPVGVAMHHVNTPPPRPSSINPTIPAQIDEIVMRAMAKDPTDRFPSGAALESALRNWDSPQYTSYATAPARRSTTAVVDAPPVREPRRRQRQPTGRTSRRRVPPPPPPAQTSRNELGCVTWIIGSVLLVTIVGAVLAALQWGPELFESGSSGSSDPTPTAEVAADLPTETAAEEAPSEPPPTETPTEAPPTPTAPPTETPTPEPTATESIPTQAIPELRNGTVQDARAAVEPFWTLAIEEEYSETVPEGNVIRQEPAPGTELAEGETVTIWVSLGSSMVAVPDVSGMTEEEAIAEIEAAGFSASTAQEPSLEFEEGVVIRTEPSGEAEPGSEIVVIVSSGDNIEIPNIFGVDVLTARDTLEESGLVVRNVVPQTCDVIHSYNPDFDCESVGPNQVIGIASGSETLTWGDVVPRGTPIDLVYFQGSSTP